jgi:hypothetical protein
MGKDIITIEVEGEHIAWNNELNALIEELEKNEAILAEKYTPQNKKKIEHFQNQFLIQKNAISNLKNEIQKHDLAIEREGKAAFEPVEDQDLKYHEIISQKIDTALKIIKELREEFSLFLEKQ